MQHIELKEALRKYADESLVVIVDDSNTLKSLKPNKKRRRECKLYINCTSQHLI